MATKNPSPIQLRNKIARLDRYLRDAQRFVLEVSENFFTFDEKYYECFYCGGELDEHDDDCIVLEAKVFAEKLARFIAEQDQPEEEIHGTP